jgi:hypothetical protein
MKKYKTSEAIAMLEKNPKLVFEDEVRVCGDIGTGKRVRMWVNSCQEIKIDGVSVGVRYGLNTNDEWELIQQPVDFITAVNSKNRIKVVYQPQYVDTRYLYFNDLIKVLSCFDLQEIITKGTWYVEDSNE